MRQSTDVTSVQKTRSQSKKELHPVLLVRQDTLLMRSGLTAVTITAELPLQSLSRLLSLFIGPYSIADRGKLAVTLRSLLRNSKATKIDLNVENFSMQILS